MSEPVFDLCAEFTPNIEQISIDEAFIDTTGSTHLFGDSAAIAAAMRKRVRQETGLILSVGVASTKFLAKVASRVAKPDGLLVIDPAIELALPPRPPGQRHLGGGGCHRGPAGTARDRHRRRAGGHRCRDPAASPGPVGRESPAQPGVEPRPTTW